MIEVSVGTAAGYGGLALASALATAFAYRYGDRIVAWDRRIRRRAYDLHPSWQLWHNPYARPTPNWMWVPSAVFCLLLTVLFAIAAVSTPSPACAVRGRIPSRATYESARQPVLAFERGEVVAVRVGPHVSEVHGVEESVAARH